MKAVQRIGIDGFIGIGIAAAFSILLAAELGTEVKADIFGALSEKILGEKVFPTLVLGGMIISGITLTVVSIRKNAISPAVSGMNVPPPVLKVIAVSILYGILLLLIGYLPASVISLALLFRIFGQRHYMRIIIPAIVVPFLFYLLFEKGLMLMLPKGIFF